MNEELLKKARGASSPEELLKLAKENGMEEFTEESAKAYFETLHRSGELSDDELENAAGGCSSGGRKVVTLGNVCSNYDFWRCKHCLAPYQGCHCNIWKRPTSLDDAIGVTMTANVIGTCATCGYCSYEKGTWYCNNPSVNG